MAIEFDLDLDGIFAAVGEKGRKAAGGGRQLRGKPRFEAAGCHLGAAGILQQEKNLGGGGACQAFRGGIVDRVGD